MTISTWTAPVIEELSVPGGTEGAATAGRNDDNGQDDGTLS